MRQLISEPRMLPPRRRASEDLSLREVIEHLCTVVEDAKTVIADEAAQYIVKIKQLSSRAAHRAFLPNHKVL